MAASWCTTSSPSTSEVGEQQDSARQGFVLTCSLEVPSPQSVSAGADSEGSRASSHHAGLLAPSPDLFLGLALEPFVSVQ